MSMKHVFLCKRLEGCIEELIFFDADKCTEKQAKARFVRNIRNDKFGKQQHFYTFGKTDYRSIKYEGLMFDKEILKKYEFQVAKVTDFICKQKECKPIGRKIEMIRKAKNISAKQLDDAIGRRETTIHKYEKGYTKNISYNLVSEIADYLGISVNVLWND